MQEIVRQQREDEDGEDGWKDHVDTKKDSPREIDFPSERLP